MASASELRALALRVAKVLRERGRGDESLAILCAGAAAFPSDSDGQALLAEALRINEGAPLARMAFERMEAFYRAYQRFQAIVHDPRHHWRFLLEPGDFVFYDNHRVLHARTGFQGPRWVRGVYFDTADSRNLNARSET